MVPEKGQVVVSKAGHDKGDLLLALGLKGNRILVCDGRQRKLEKPKEKNPKHLVFTSLVLKPEEYASNHRLRKALFHLSETKGG